MKVLLAIDSSPVSKNVLREIEMRPWPENTTMCVLNVVDVVSGATVLMSLEPFVKEETEAAQKLVEDAADRIRNRVVQVTAEVATGDPAKEIVEQAKNWEADFIFSGSHGHSGITRFLVGSVAKAVLRDAHCSVGIVRPRKDAGRSAIKILLATDGSDSAMAAARSVAARPWPEGSEIRVLSAVASPLPPVDLLYVAHEVTTDIHEQALKQAEEDVRAALSIVNDAGLNATGSAVVGYPKAMILDEAEEWGADLIVLGSRGRRGLARLVLGSVSEAVAMHANCSVEVIRQREES